MASHTIAKISKTRPSAMEASLMRGSTPQDADVARPFPKFWIAECKSPVEQRCVREDSRLVTAVYRVKSRFNVLACNNLIGSCL